MCIEDWRLGKLMRTQITSAAVTSGQTTSVLANPNRVGIYLANSLGTLATNNSSTVTIDGIFAGICSGGTGAWHITLPEYGDLVTKSFTLTCPTTACTQFIIEQFLPESVIRANTADFQSGEQS